MKGGSAQVNTLCRHSKDKQGYITLWNPICMYKFKESNHDGYYHLKVFRKLILWQVLGNSAFLVGFRELSSQSLSIFFNLQVPKCLSKMLPIT